jgi:nucleoid-associated protein YgaU
MGRYDKSKVFRDNTGTRYLNRIQYPKIEISDTDVTIVGLYGQRLENLAHKFYGNTELWWIIARANGQLDGSTYMVPGKEYRIPQDIARIIEDFEELNR